jgi:hypothetical protein
MYIEWCVIFQGYEEWFLTLLEEDYVSYSCQNIPVQTPINKGRGYKMEQLHFIFINYPLSFYSICYMVLEHVTKCANNILLGASSSKISMPDKVGSFTY